MYKSRLNKGGVITNEVGVDIKLKGNFNMDSSKILITLGVKDLTPLQIQKLEDYVSFDEIVKRETSITNGKIRSLNYLVSDKSKFIHYPLQVVCVA